MLTAENIQKMNRRNISANEELTKQRVKEVLKSATRAQKNEIDALAGVKRVSINRVYTVGAISAKIAVAIAQTLNVDPFYLTGESDERGECNDLVLDAFLLEKGYADLTKLSSKSKKPASHTQEKQKSSLLLTSNPLLPNSLQPMTTMMIKNARIVKLVLMRVVVRQ